MYSKQAKEQLYNIKRYISRDSNISANNYLVKIKNKIEILREYPYIGKVNTTFNVENIRDFIVFGYKVIYKINKTSIVILAIYKYIDFNEKSININ